MWRNILLLTFGTLFLMLGIGYFTTDPAKQEKPEKAQILLLFDQIAFSGYGEAGPTGTGPYLRRWETPVKVALLGAPSQPSSDGDKDKGERPWAKAVSDLLSLYDALPNLEVTLQSEQPFSRDIPPEANLAIITVPDSALDDLLPTLPPKIANALADKRQGCAVIGAEAAALNNVSILLADGLSTSRRSSCLGESLATALGFTIETKMAGNVFRVRQDGLSFHGLGRMAAALVYDPGLQPGMPRDQARSIAADLLTRKGLE